MFKQWSNVARVGAAGLAGMALQGLELLLAMPAAAHPHNYVHVEAAIVIEGCAMSGASILPISMG
jgi:hypothetical protein